MTITFGSTVVTQTGDSQYGPHHIGCGRCGESATYSGREFTVVEAQRHERWCAAHKG